MATIKRTTKEPKVTKEAKALKIFETIPEDKKEVLYILLGQIVIGKVKNFYSTKVFKNLTEDLSVNQRTIVSYICQRAAQLKVFENMEKLILTEGK